MRERILSFLLLAIALSCGVSTARQDLPEFHILLRADDSVPGMPGHAWRQFHHADWWRGGVVFNAELSGSLPTSRVLAVVRDGSPRILVRRGAPLPPPFEDRTFDAAMPAFAVDGTRLVVSAPWRDGQNLLNHALLVFDDRDADPEVWVSRTWNLFAEEVPTSVAPSLLRARAGRVLLGKRVADSGYVELVLYDGEAWQTVAATGRLLTGGEPMKFGGGMISADLSADGTRVALIVTDDDDPSNPERRFLLYEWREGSLDLLAWAEAGDWGGSIPVVRYGVDDLYLTGNLFSHALLRYDPEEGVVKVPVPEGPGPDRSGVWIRLEYQTFAEDVDFFVAQFSLGNPDGIFGRDVAGAYTEVFRPATSLDIPVGSSRIRSDGNELLAVSPARIATTLPHSGPPANPWLGNPLISGWRMTEQGPIFDSEFPFVYPAMARAWLVLVQSGTDAEWIGYLPEQDLWINNVAGSLSWVYVYGSGWHDFGTHGITQK